MKIAVVSTPKPSFCTVLRRPQPKHVSVKPHSGKRDGQSGIHDPAGPQNSWGAGEARARQERLAQEEGFRLSEQNLSDEDARADQRVGNHGPGHVGVNRVAAVDSQLKEIAGERSDDEWEHMPKTQKWFMELKNALYSWLKTGVEPL